jgi:hypothetical protein
MSIEETINTGFGFLHNITDFIRQQLIKSAPDYVTLILLGLSIGIGYYLNNKYPGLLTKVSFLWLGLIVFLILKFI